MGLSKRKLMRLTEEYKKQAAHLCVENDELRHANKKLRADALEISSIGKDAVNHPGHYTSGTIECIDAIQASMPAKEFQGYLKGNVLKYVWRYEHKGLVQDLEKAEWYLTKLINTLNDVPTTE